MPCYVALQLQILMRYHSCCHAVTERMQRTCCAQAFCEAITEAGIAWLGPTSKTMHDFSLKHVARELASEAGVGHLLCCLCADAA